MSLSANITKNSLIQLVGKFLSLAIGLVVVGIMTRYLGQEGYGFYTTVITFLQFFGILVDFGLTLTSVQLISAPGAKVNKIMNNVMTLRILSSIVFLGLAPILIMFFPYPAIIKIGVLVVSLSFFCITLIQTLTVVFQKELKMMLVTVAEVVGRVVLLALVLVAVYWHLGIVFIFWAISIGSVLNLLIVWLSSRKYVRLKPEFDWGVWKEVVLKSWPIALSISFNLIYLRLDTLILSLTRTQAEVGLYGASYRVVDILTNLPAVYMGIVLPHLTALYLADKKPQLFSLLQKVFNNLMLFAIPIVLGTYLVSNKLMLLVAGSEFVLSGKILNVLILASGAIFFTSLSGYAVLVIHEQRKILWCYLTTAVLTTVGYFIFIPRFGVWGAAWMTVFSEVMVAVWTFIVVYRKIKFLPKLNNFIKYLLASFLMLAVIYIAIDLPILLLLTLAGGVYFGAVYLLGGLKKDLGEELL